MTFSLYHNERGVARLLFNTKYLTCVAPICLTILKGVSLWASNRAEDDMQTGTDGRRGSIMHLNIIIPTPVGADLSRPAPIYRPSPDVPLARLFCSCA